MQAVHDGDWKLRRVKETDMMQTEMFDLAEDPAERVNLMGQYPNISDKLITLLAAYPDKGQQ